MKQHGHVWASVAPIHKFADIPIYRFLSFCTADTNANTDTLGNYTRRKLKLRLNDFTDCPPLDTLTLQMLQDALQSLSPAVKNCHIGDLLFDISIDNRSTCRIMYISVNGNHPYTCICCYNNDFADADSAPMRTYRQILINVSAYWCNTT